MHYFKFRGKILYCEDTKVESLSKKYGTPLYLYSDRTLREHFNKIRMAFSAVRPLICYSVKANSNLTILKRLVSSGAGLDIVSGGELYRAKRVGCPPKKIVYASVGKTDQEIEEAIRCGILIFNVESIPELAKINRIARRLKKKVTVALRINPDIAPRTHRYIVTGRKGSKFGISISAAKRIIINNNVYPHLHIAGIHLHIGSQITEALPFLKAIKKAKALIKGLEKNGILLEYLNIGGGLGITYRKERPQTAKEFARKVVPLLRSIGLKVIIEPGRFIAGNAGVLVTKVLYLKQSGQKRFIVVDAAMNDLARPSLYAAYHKIVPVVKRPKAKSQRLKPADVVGPICESADFLGKDRKLNVEADDYLAVLGSGAYGFSMSSNYNSRLRAAEVLVKGNKAYLIRERERYSDIIKREIIWCRA